MNNSNKYHPVVKILWLQPWPARVMEFNLKFLPSAYQFGWAQVDAPSSVAVYWGVGMCEIQFVCICLIHWWKFKTAGSQNYTKHKNSKIVILVHFCWHFWKCVNLLKQRSQRRHFPWFKHCAQQNTIQTSYFQTSYMQCSTSKLHTVKKAYPVPKTPRIPNMTFGPLLVTLLKMCRPTQATFTSGGPLVAHQWTTGCHILMHREMCPRWSTECAASGGPLDVPHLVDH